ncbi:S9 family peptidase [Parabacteroides sp. OttesenSCG-928-J18]|nr:S9 family peptidase [Parabacteroides sp. OttesenSCG-928-J18]
MKKIFFALFLLLPIVALAQVTKTDYDRSDTILHLNKYVYAASIQPQWINGTHTFWYMNHERGGDFYYMVDADKRQKNYAFSHDKLASLLSKEIEGEVSRNNLPLINVKFPDKEKMTFMAGGASWEYIIRQNKLIRLNANGAAEENASRRDPRSNNAMVGTGNSVVSPDNLWEAYVRDNNVYIKRTFNEEEFALTMDGTMNHYYSSQLVWSPDSRRLITLKVKDTETRRIPLIESAPEKQLQPELRWRNYAKPGDLLAARLPVMFDVENKTQMPLDTDLYENQYSLRLTGWRADGRGFTFDFNERGHQRFIVAEVNAKDGKIHHVVDEQSETFIYYNKLYKYYLNDGQQTLWISERDGWRHLYMLDGHTGRVIRQITKGEWVVRDVLKVDEERGMIYFTASGFNKEEDPYNLHYCCIKLDGTGFADLTKENGNHRAVFSDDYAYFVDSYSRPDLPPVYLLKKTDTAEKTMDLEKADIEDLIAKGWTIPEVFHAKGRDGQTDIWGNIIRPSHFDPNKSYPVIEMIYAGPHDSHVNKNFSPTYHLISKLAELGFIVVSIDGMGTYNRSKAFHDVSWKNLKDAGFPDRKLWIEAAAEKYPYMDISRVGIYGWSAGGQNAMAALLFHNDFYKVAVAFCGCHDNRMDKMWWNEQWMGYPIDKSYSESSNVDNAHLLKGKLLLVNGELDDNVDPTSTLQVVSALMKANKNFEQLYLPGKGHSLGGNFELRKMHDFFVKHLKNQDPPEWE